MDNKIRTVVLGTHLVVFQREEECSPEYRLATIEEVKTCLSQAMIDKHMKTLKDFLWAILQIVHQQVPQIYTSEGTVDAFCETSKEPYNLVAVTRIDRQPIPRQYGKDPNAPKKPVILIKPALPGTPETSPEEFSEILDELSGDDPSERWKKGDKEDKD